MSTVVGPALRTLLSNPAARAAAHNFGWLAAEKLFRLVFGVGISFWVARYLGPEGLGLLSYSMAIVVLVAFLPGLGLDAVLKREVLEKPEAATQLLASGLILRLAAAVTAFVALFVLSPFLAETPVEARLLLIAAGLVFQPALLLPDLWLQTQLRAAWAVTVQVGALVVSGLLRLVLVAAAASVEWFALVAIFEMTLCGIGLLIATRRLGLRFSPREARREWMRTLLRESWPLMLASLAVSIYMRIDEVMLRHLVGPEAVGIYSAATRLSEIWYFLPLVLGTSVLPALLRARARDAEAYADRMQLYYDVSAAAAYVLSVPLALLAPWLVRLAYGGAYAEAGPILAVHIWSSVFVFLGVARGQWLVNERLQYFYLATTVAGAIVNVALNAWLIPLWGGLGAAYATVISYAISAWLGSFCHAAVRPTAGMQTRALLIPILGWRYLRRR